MAVGVLRSGFGDMFGFGERGARNSRARQAATRRKCTSRVLIRIWMLDHNQEFHFWRVFGPCFPSSTTHKNPHMRTNTNKSQPPRRTDLQQSASPRKHTTVLPWLPGCSMSSRDVASACRALFFRGVAPAEARGNTWKRVRLDS